MRFVHTILLDNMIICEVDIVDIVDIVEKKIILFLVSEFFLTKGIREKDIYRLSSSCLPSFNAHLWISISSISSLRYNRLGQVSRDLYCCLHYAGDCFVESGLSIENTRTTFVM